MIRDLPGRALERIRTYLTRPPTSSRHEIVVALASVGLLTGVASIVRPELRPNSVLDQLPRWLTIAWLITLTLGAAGLLLSIAWPDRITSWLIEGPALYFLGAGCLVYGVCLASIWLGTAFVAATTYLIWGSACVWRAVHIALYVRTLPRTDG